MSEATELKPLSGDEIKTLEREFAQAILDSHITGGRADVSHLREHALANLNRALATLRERDAQVEQLGKAAQDFLDYWDSEDDLSVLTEEATISALRQALSDTRSAG